MEKDGADDGYDLERGAAGRLDPLRGRSHPRSVESFEAMPLHINPIMLPPEPKRSSPVKREVIDYFSMFLD